MPDTSQEAVLLALAERQEIFQIFEEVFSSPNYHKVLMSFEADMKYSEISEEVDVAMGTVSLAFEELEEYGLIEKDEKGNRQHSLPVLTHPIIQYYYWKEVVGDE